MKFKPGNEVVIIADTLNLGLPINSAGIVQVVDRHIDHFQNYCVRVPQRKDSWWVCESDIEFASVVNSKVADDLIKDHLVNLSLDTNNKQLFKLATQKNGS
ncbi:hypothetical protein LSG31_00540 [Fodinisporobacter ferrooxydans]|uniref:Uncharacterized protein n=1 Tax=Fodinisporobacter ferrooxydans TaxID=2901836 RepID=A0ABY4CJV8_9BACL|nr:hypothetical protein LSG31_00540 [Alicyclobacillaceae bacterium MYW30-H2]